ncbi:hypothetical protein BH11MYX2_BH11MYX2_35820 [soil metagenome]
MKRVLLIAALAACGGTQKTGGGDEAIVKISSNVRDAQLYVDGRYIAPISSLGGGIIVEPGAHRLELRSDEYFSAYLEVSVAGSDRKTVAMKLAPRLP